MPAEKVFWSYEESAEKGKAIGNDGSVGDENNNTTSESGENGATNRGEAKNNSSNASESGINTDGNEGGFTYSGKGNNKSSFGKGKSKSKLGGKLKAFGAVGFILAILILFLGFFSFGNLAPAALQILLTEETDVGYADAVDSKLIIIQAAMRGQDENGDDTGKGGDLPDNVVEILKQKGVLVGYPDSSAEGGFREANQLESGPLYLKIDDKVVSADNLITETHNNVKLYNAIEAATYGRAEYYYDDTFGEIYKEVGVDQEIFKEEDEEKENDENDDESEDEKKKAPGSGIDAWSTKSSDIGTKTGDTTTKDKVCGTQKTYLPSSVSANTGVSEVERTVCTQEVETENITYVDTNNSKGEHNSGDGVDEFINSVAEKHLSNNELTATENSADALKATDAISEQQRAATFYLTGMTEISNMMAGEGNDSNVHGFMNFMTERTKTKVFNVETGTEDEVEGSALESPILFSLLTKSPYDATDSRNFTNDRVLKTIEKHGIGTDSIDTSVMKGTVTTARSGIKGEVGRFIENTDSTVGNTDQLHVASPILKSSLVDNSYDNYKSILGGEALVKGATYISGKNSAAAGAAVGDDYAVSTYLKKYNEVARLEAASDRINRSPFDITSKNTFLGSIVHNMAISLYYSKSNNSLLSNMLSFIQTTSFSIRSLLPMAHAEETTSVLSSYGVGCESLDNMGGVVGSPHCIGVRVFDSSTLNDPLNNEEYKRIIKENKNGTSIKEDSDYADYIIGTQRKAPDGATDADVLDAVVEDGSCNASGVKYALAGENGRKDCGESPPTSGGESILEGIITRIINLFKEIVDSLSKSIAVLFKYSISDEDQKLKANGTMYANTAITRGEASSSEVTTEDNTLEGSWETNKIFQRDMALTRAMSDLREVAVNYDGRVAYDIPGFEWEENPVLAFIRDYKDKNTVIAEKTDDDNSKMVELREIFSFLDTNPEMKELVDVELRNRYGMSISQLAQHL